MSEERLAGRYGFLEQNGLLPLPIKGGITLVVELSRLECASACLRLLLNHSEASVCIVAVAMTPDIPLETVAQQFSSGERIWFIPYEDEEYVVNKALAYVETAYAVLLEDSIMVSAGWLNELLWVFYDDPSIKIVAPLSSSEKGEGIQSLHFSTYLEMADHVSSGLRRHQGEWRQVEVLTGSCLLFTSDLIQGIGGLDRSLLERHLMIADWCLRARQLGAKLVLSDAVYVHAIHSLDRYHWKQDSMMHADGWQSYCEKWSLERSQKMDQESGQYLVPHSNFFDSAPMQKVIPLSTIPVPGPIVTVIVYVDEHWESAELRDSWIQILDQQSYKNLRWIWIRDTLVDIVLEPQVNEHTIVLTVSGEEARLQAINHASAWFESEIILYLSTSTRYEYHYIERVVKAITQGSANLVVSLSTEMEAGAVPIPLEHVAYKKGIKPGVISSKASNNYGTYSRHLQLHADPSLSIGYIGDFSLSKGIRTERHLGKEAHP